MSDDEFTEERAAYKKCIETLAGLSITGVSEIGVGIIRYACERADEDEDGGAAKLATLIAAAVMDYTYDVRYEARQAVFDAADLAAHEKSDETEADGSSTLQ